MTIKTLLTAAALVAAPMIAWADCSYHEQAKMTCAEGSAYDAESGTCKVISG
ncbi:MULTISPECIES: adenylosuccinate lyase [Roseobacteraceae]|uniref:adenylosuccinate lyase n=1 Tax=Roseobacteraceae TaxID=2854170 RepID=UPI00080ABED5|nr:MULTISPECIES: adenylosuccinate lyase [Roseobacteraceae]ANT59151.1 adenylosuccinate lyase [Salipiger sp. CCB-MM3]MCA0996466.1 adenylosuccinate lyase [Alloyangia pacifica]NDV98112.1 adenylosuccinate lyase [Salipiger sp. PrR002]NDW57087.1 adenylosuccinate lyase [Salipiger sp. PrR004]